MSRSVRAGVAFSGLALSMALAAGSAPADAPSPAAPPASGTAQAASGTAQSAHWVEKKLHFVYQGFTAKYSCDGLRDDMQLIVRQLGARKDSKVNEMGCTSGPGRPDPFPGVTGRLYVLQPAAPDAKDAVAAHWQPVRVSLRDPTEIGNQGVCELLEQVKHDIVPLFAARNVKYDVMCVPHQVTLGSSTLTAEVLMPDRPNKPDAPAAPGPGP